MPGRPTRPLRGPMVRSHLSGGRPLAQPSVVDVRQKPTRSRTWSRLAVAAAASLAIAGLISLQSTPVDVRGRPTSMSSTAAVAGGEAPAVTLLAPTAQGAATSPSSGAAPPAEAPAVAPSGSPPLAFAAETSDRSLPTAEVPVPALTRMATPSPACAAALAVVEASGHDLPEQTEFRCPGSAQTYPGDRQHSGVACWDHAHFCPGGSFIAVNPDEIRPIDRALQYVVAHEICHIHAYERTSSPGSENAADQCAAAAGFPRP